MKRSLFRLLSVSLSILAIALFAGSVLAQGKGGGKKGGDDGGGGEDPPSEYEFGYQAIWPTVSESIISPTFSDFVAWADIDSGKKHALGVGNDYGAPKTALLYDHGGLIDSDLEMHVYTIIDLFPTLPEWVPDSHTMSFFRGVNTSGRVVGAFSNPDSVDNKIGFFFDITDTQPQLRKIQVPQSHTDSILNSRLRINEIGQILFTANSVTSGKREAFVFDPGNPNDLGDDSYLPLFDSNGHPLAVNDLPYFNSTGCVVAERESGTIVRFPIDGPLDDYHDFYESTRPMGINDFDQVACRSEYAIRRNRVNLRASRLESDRTITLIDPDTGYSDDINNSGDVIGRDGTGGSGPGYLYYEGDWINTQDQLFAPIIELILDGPEESPLLTSNDWHIQKMSDRDSNGYPWIIGVGFDGSTDAGGNPIRAFFLLIPEILP